MPNQSWISYFSNLVKQYGGINLAQGIPGFQPPDDLLKLLSKTAKKNIHQYAPGTGNHKLRAEIMKMYKGIIPEDEFSLLVTNGGTEAIHLLYLSFHKYKNKLRAAAFAPVYESYMHLPRIHGDDFKSLPLESEKGKLSDRLANFFSSYNPDVFFANSPGNPSGYSLNKAEFDKLAELCTNYNCKLLIDAVYDKLYFENPPYYPFEKLNKNIFYINSFSKLYSITGWRLGYFFCHKSYMDDIINIHDYTGLSSPSVLQESLAEFMKTGSEKDSYVEDTRQILKSNYFAGKKILQDAGFKVSEAKGGYFIWTKLPSNNKSSIDFSKQVYDKKKTAVIPGSHFGKEFDNYIRINIARKSDELISGIKKIRELSDELV